MSAQNGGLSDQAELTRVVTLFEAGKYPECVAEFEQLLGKEPELEEPEVVERARVYFATCLIAINKPERADEQLRQAIRENPQMRPPDRLTFPQEVVDRFLTVQQSMTEEIKKAEEERLKKAQAAARAAAERRRRERERVARLEEYAQREIIVQENKRWLAMVPFGIGQFQNRDTALGYLFLGSEVALAGTALGAMVVSLSLNAQSDDQPPPNNDELNANLATAHNVIVFSSWGFLAVATAGIVEAQLSFEPEFREIRKRPLPPELRRGAKQSSSLRLMPSAAPAPGGFSLGLSGQF